MSKNSRITPEIASLLNGKNFAFLATLMKDGSPQVSPTWVDVEHGLILINTAEGRLKQRNVSRDPRVAVALYDQKNPYNMVAIRGRVVEQTNEGAEEHINKLARKYLGVAKYPLRTPKERRVILKIKPKKMLHQKPPRQD